MIELDGQRAGMWIDFATGEGGDIFEVWARVMHMDAQRDFPQVMESVAQWLGDVQGGTHVGSECSPASATIPDIKKHQWMNLDLRQPSGIIAMLMAD